ncbi:hypothetical protein LTR56_013173 [Elasticomyces elasticus]|nr:hypothetical protein LTR56_013173 [Elasticomyces elasticus]KAK3656651.1 hypothetical protein LTR22_009630 [Elasticomyces elasticus]KAK4921523.1 hypothetical protein LTR49_010993 [Elasticomyces elasticus]KAK5760211.1 hypothetical protein LTS12_009595 [Elasticomyces elasticus]
MNGSLATAVAPTPTAYPSHAQQPYSSIQHSPQATAAAALSEGESANGSKKRKATGAPGSRGVANLTPEQLAKKRANDREAQRAIRERTRNTIANLEQRIRELESQQPFQELQRVIQERNDAVHECEALRQRLAQVAQVAQVVGPANGNGGQHQYAGQQVAGAGLNGTFTIDDLIDPTWLNADGAELAALTAQQAPLPPHPSQQQHAGAQAQYYDTHVHPDLRSPSYVTTHDSPASTHTEGVPTRKWSPGPQQYPPTNGIQYEQHQPPPAPVQQPGEGERDRLGLNYIMDRSPPNGHPAVPAYHQPSQQPPSPPLYARLPSNTPPSCPLDSLLSDFIANRRQQLSAGVSMQDVLGPEYPSFTALQDPNSPARKNCHPVTALLIDIISKFPDISALPEKVAVLYIMFLVMRWFICPCETCYGRLPEWVRPVAEQLDRPHATWVDDLPWSVSTETPPQEEAQETPFDFDLFCSEALQAWSGSEAAGTRKMTGDQLANTFFRPFMRKQLASSSMPIRFDEFFVPYTTTLSLNWPYPESHVLISTTTSEEGGVMLNPVFENHLRNLEHWSLGTDFQKTFPGLVDENVRIHSTKA